MDTQTPDSTPASTAPADDFEDPDGMKPFVEHYLVSRGFNVCSRNARLVVAALATCHTPDPDWPALEQHVDIALNREMLRPAA